MQTLLYTKTNVLIKKTILFIVHTEKPTNQLILKHENFTRKNEHKESIFHDSEA